MERESPPERFKLTVVASIDYPDSSEILVSFPDKWELVERLSLEEEPLYVAAMPPQEERPRRDRFYGLPAEINGELSTYRLYKLFQPWPMPRITVSWDEAAGAGQVESVDDLKMQLQPIGQAQAWKGHSHGLIWECYLQSTPKRANWQDELLQFWRSVEGDLGVPRIYTQPHEPAFEEGAFEESYEEFLERLGYGADPAHPRWWSKMIEG